jgi:tetratricopeptide (TPR) repeat protein
MQIVITGVMALALQAGLGNTATTTRPPLGEVDVLGLVATGVCSSRVAELVGQRGIAFTPKPAYVELLRTAGAQQELLEAIRVAEVHQVEPGTHGPAAPDDATALEPLNAFAQAVQTKLDPKPAEQALIAAFNVQSGDGFSRFVVATVLSRLGQHQESIAQLRQAVRLEPDFADAHERLGSALADDKDWEGAIAELQAALRLDPNAADIHRRLASALLQKGDRGSAKPRRGGAEAAFAPLWRHAHPCERQHSFGKTRLRFGAPLPRAGEGG